MKLNKEFKPVSIEDWENKLIKELKIDDLSQKQWKISDQIELKPAYFKDKKRKISLPVGSLRMNNWSIGEDFKIGKFDKGNKELLEALMAGCEYPGIKLGVVPKQKEWAVLFKDIKLNFIHLHFELTKEVKPLAFIRSFHSYIKKNYSKTKSVKGILSFAHQSKQDEKVISLAQDLLPGFKSICINLQQGRKKIAAEQVLANALIELESCIFDLLQEGLSITKIRDKIVFRTFSSKGFYLSLSKIRALKILVMNLLKAYKLKKDFEVPVVCYSDPKDYVKDANTNNIIASTQTMAAILAGIDRLVVSAPNKSGKHTQFSRRVSRNIQHIMKMESNLDLVYDSAAGSYFLDELTEQLVDAAWRIFVAHSKEE